MRSRPYVSSMVIGSRLFFDQLQIPRPDINLEVGSGSHAEQTAQIMLRFEPVLQQIKPDAVVVVGDANSTIACSLTACKMQIPVGHVEAGLRTNDIYSPYPEEINRPLADRLAVHKHLRLPIHRPKMEQHALAAPRLGHFERAPVGEPVAVLHHA